MPPTCAGPGCGSCCTPTACGRPGAAAAGSRAPIDVVRRRAERGVSAGLGPEQAALARGMVLGADEDISERMAVDFKRSGLAHLLAVSGQNVTLLAVLAWPLLGALGIPRAPRLWVVIALIALYVPLTGAGPSIVRAGAMGIAGTLAALAGRPASRWYGLLLACVVTLALDPRAWQDVGWQLSFAAVVGIFALARPLGRALGPLPEPLRSRDRADGGGDDRDGPADGVPLRARVARGAAREPRRPARGRARDVAGDVERGRRPGSGRAGRAAERLERLLPRPRRRGRALGRGAPGRDGRRAHRLGASARGGLRRRGRCAVGRGAAGPDPRRAGAARRGPDAGARGRRRARLRLHAGRSAAVHGHLPGHRAGRRHSAPGARRRDRAGRRGPAGRGPRGEAARPRRARAGRGGAHARPGGPPGRARGGGAVVPGAAAARRRPAAGRGRPSPHRVARRGSRSAGAGRAGASAVPGRRGPAAAGAGRGASGTRIPAPIRTCARP